MKKSRGSGHQRPEPRDARHGKMMGNLYGNVWLFGFLVTRCSLTGMICFFWEHVSQHVPWQGTEHGVWCPRREILGRNPSQKWTFAVWQEGNFIGPLIEAPKKHIFLYVSLQPPDLGGSLRVCGTGLGLRIPHELPDTRTLKSLYAQWAQLAQFFPADGWRYPWLGDAYRSYRVIRLVVCCRLFWSKFGGSWLEKLPVTWQWIASFNRSRIYSPLPCWIAGGGADETLFEWQKPWFLMNEIPEATQLMFYRWFSQRTKPPFSSQLRTLLENFWGAKMAGRDNLWPSLRFFREEQLVESRNTNSVDGFFCFFSLQMAQLARSGRLWPGLDAELPGAVALWIASAMRHGGRFLPISVGSNRLWKPQDDLNCQMAPMKFFI